MQKIQIGQTDIQASKVALGVMRINDKSASEAQKIVQTAYGNGINFLIQLIFMVQGAALKYLVMH